MLSIWTATAAPAIADPPDAVSPDSGSEQRDSRPRHQRHGFLIGVNAGIGASHVAFTLGPAEVRDDRSGALFGGYRLGYAVSNSIAFTLEGRSYYSSDSQGDWQLYGTFLTLTWWPDGCGFFLRAGLGGGKIETIHDIGQTDLQVDEQADLLALGMGYEWRLGRHFALGGALDFVGGDIDVIEDLLDLRFGSGGISIQFNWYL
jgi:hypothetical protein